MSVTTTDNPITISLRQTLGDYEIHVTGDENDRSGEITQLNASNTTAVVENPPSWPQDYHRIPHYRPVNRSLNWSERPLGTILGEQIFLHIMFTGVSLNAGTAQLWGATGGKIFTKVFRYAIGGEW